MLNVGQVIDRSGWMNGHVQYEGVELVWTRDRFLFKIIMWLG